MSLLLPRQIRECNLDKGKSNSEHLNLREIEQYQGERDEHLESRLEGSNSFSAIAHWAKTQGKPMLVVVQTDGNVL
jgi:hypothetical protein